MQAALKIDTRVRAPHPSQKRTRARAKIFFLHNAQHMKRQRILAECLTLGATLLSMFLWGVVLLLFAN